MSNLKHYIEKIKNGDVFFDEKMKMNIALYLAGCLHAVFFFVSLIMGVVPMAAYSIVSAAIYFLLLPVFVKKDKLYIAVTTAVIEVTVNALVATLVMGIGTGFSIYLLAMLPVCFYLVTIASVYIKKEFACVVYSIFIFVSYIVIYVLSLFIKPVYTVSAGWKIGLTCLNITGFFVVAVLFLFLIEWDVLYRNATLANNNSLLNEMANKDALTKLFNRRFIDKKLMDKHEELNDKGTIFGIIMGDIDNFKKINDTYGHESGDEILVGVAEILMNSVREKDFVSRWGGEEFLIVINGNKKIATDVAERMRQMISDREFELNGEKVNITMTFGVVESIPGFSVEKLVQIADDNLYKGKQNGKNQVVS